MIDLVDTIGSAAVAWLITAYQSLHDAVLGGSTGLLGLAVTLFIVLYGYGVMSGRMQATMPELFGKIAILVIVFVGVTDVAEFNALLRVFFLNVPDGIANTLIGGSGSNDVRVALQSTFDTAFQAATAIWDNASWHDILQNMLGLMIIVMTMLFVGFACFLLCLAKVGTCVLLAMTPLMFIGLLFGITRSIFERWLGLLFNYWFIPILTFLILSFVCHVAQETAQSVKDAYATGGDVSLDAIAKYLGCCTIGFLLLLQVMAMASALGGGVALSTLGAAGAAGAWIGKQFSPSSKRYIGGGRGFEGRTRTVTGDLNRIGRTLGFKRDRDGLSQKP